MTVTDEKLHLVWSAGNGRTVPVIGIDPIFALRPLMATHRSPWIELMRGAGFFLNPDRDAADLFDRMWPLAQATGDWLGIFRDGRLVASDFMTAGAHPLYPGAAELFYVAVEPAWRGHRLAKALAAAHLRSATEIGYETVYVETDDYRLNSIKNCLGLGFRPNLYAPDMKRRWQAVLERLNLSIDLED